jgi:hypothetical protein
LEWFAVRTARDHEGRATIGIGGLGLESYMPIELERRDFRGRREVGWRPLFVGQVESSLGSHPRARRRSVPRRGVGRQAHEGRRMTGPAESAIQSCLFQHLAARAAPDPLTKR